MSETCKIRAGQIKFQGRKPDWACKIVESKPKKYWAKQTRMADMEILLIRDTNGCNCRRRLWQTNQIKNALAKNKFELV